MQVLQVRNVHQALPEAVALLKQWGYEEPTRNGPVLRYPQAVCTTYLNPRERVLFWPERNANPFFHLYEALWMLGGRQDVASLTRFVKRMAQFSNNGITFHGAYGHRWRRHFGMDQLSAIINNLRDNHTCRRQVLQMWDANDLRNQTVNADVPCNLVATFQVNALGALDLTVFCRSNDIVWGCYGANAVHFSMLHEYVAIAVGRPVGMYEHVSVNWHAYLDTFAPLRELDQYRPMPAHAGPQPNNLHCPYSRGQVVPFRLINTSREQWDQDLGMFLDQGTKAMGYQDIFFRGVALPMLRVHDLIKQDMREALQWCDNIKASDWRLACQEWLLRRKR